MFRSSLGFLLMLASATSLAGNDIWQTLFKEKLREATQGNSNAQFDVGTMYQNGRGTRADRSKAIEWFRKAAAQNNEQAASRLELLQSNEARFNKELARAEKGDVESQYNLANMYTTGVGVDIDPSQASIWYQKAASQGYVKAEYKLGLMYFEGNGVKQNYKTAFKWFRSAAEDGYPAAQYYLGKMYGTGQGTSRDYNASLGWYSKAVEGGFNQARGEMIDVADKLKTGNTEDAPVVADTEQPTGQEPADSRTALRNERSYTMDDLMLASWKRDDEHVAYLPSAINNCQIEDDRLVCYSVDQTRATAGSTIRFRTKAIISNLSTDGSFDVTYRNLVIKSEHHDAGTGSRDEVVGSLDDSIESTHKVRTGWGKEHNLECRITDSTTVSCLKNKTHMLVLTTPQTIASGMHEVSDQ